MALPLVGTGHGGARRRAGEVVHALLPVLQEASSKGIDIALMTLTDAQFAAAQSERRNHLPNVFTELDETQRKYAKQLAQLASTGQLVLFLGAGVSASAGLPDWRSLLHELAAGAHFSEPERAALMHMDVLSQASLLDRRYSAVKKDVRQEIAMMLKERMHYGLAHGLLSSLPVMQAVTTNYDGLLEQSAAPGTEWAVLPYTLPALGERWLLKMHGCVKHPHDIVLTREDFLRYDKGRQALAGIVGSLLITKHMLFTSFSLNDDNFHRVMDAVKQVLDRAGQPLDIRTLGTALLLFDDPWLVEFWKGCLDVVAFGAALDHASSDAHRSVSIAAAARRQEIFLDCLVSHCDLNAAHLLRPDFEGALDAAELELRNRLLQYVMDVPDHARRAPAWKRVARLLKELGAEEQVLQPRPKT